MPESPGIRMSDRMTSKAPAPGQLESFLAGRNLLHGVAGCPQHPAGALAHARIVVDEEDSGHKPR